MWAEEEAALAMFIEQINLVCAEGDMVLFADFVEGVTTAFRQAARACTLRFPKRCARNARS